MFWRRSKLTKREQEVRNYILQEQCQQFKLAAEADPDDKYSVGRLREAQEILSHVLDILGGL